MENLEPIGQEETPEERQAKIERLNKQLEKMLNHLK